MRRDFLIEKEFNSALKTSSLTDIKLFQINDGYFEFSENKHLIIDGGIELSFENHTFCIAWNQKTESFTFKNKRFKELYDGEKYSELKCVNIEGFDEIVENNIISANFKWDEYDIILCGAMGTRKETRLVELNIEVESIGMLQIATVDYKLGDTICPKNYTYAINGELLITLDNQIEISHYL